MYTLAFDTTGSFCSLILMKDRNEIARFSRETEFGQAEMLMEQTQLLLERYQLGISDLDLIAVCTGPGSFTGVRSSVSATRAYALACPETKVCGINAFEAYLTELDDESLADINTVLIETKREDYYVQSFDRNRHPLTPPMTAYDDDLVRFLSANGKKVTLTGDGVERFLNHPRGLSLHKISLSYGVPIEALARTALQKYDDGILDFPKPLYLKAPDVCVK